jgi:Zn-dependent protease
MIDVFAWAFPVGRLFGTQIRVHLLFPLVILPLILREVCAPYNVPFQDAAMVALIFVVATIAHEFGHVFAARYMGGEADEILVWPLGGLARASYLPNTPWTYLVFAAGGPLVNLAFFLVSGLVLAFCFEAPISPPPLLNLLTWHYGSEAGVYSLPTWAGEFYKTSNYGIAVLTWVCWINLFLVLLNIVLLGLPWDGGAMVRAALWFRMSYQQATHYAVVLGFIVAAALFFFSLFVSWPMLIFLSLYTFVSCWFEWIQVVRGDGESMFGDFSQGYTSLEQDEPAPARRKGGFISRWMQRRQARKMQKEQERQEADERRMDELLEKIQRHGKESLTDEETRFMKRVSERYRNRN